MLGKGLSINKTQTAYITFYLNKIIIIIVKKTTKWPNPLITIKAVYHFEISINFKHVQFYYMYCT